MSRLKFFILFILFVGLCLLFGQLNFSVNEMQVQGKTVWVNPQKTEVMLVNEAYRSISLFEKDGQIIKRKRSFSYSPGVIWYADKEPTPEEISLFKSIIR